MATLKRTSLPSVWALSAENKEEQRFPSLEIALSAPDFDAQKREHALFQVLLREGMPISVGIWSPVRITRNGCQRAATAVVQSITPRSDGTLALELMWQETVQRRGNNDKVGAVITALTQLFPSGPTTNRWYQVVGLQDSGGLKLLPRLLNLSNTLFQPHDMIIVAEEPVTVGETPTLHAFRVASLEDAERRVLVVYRGALNNEFSLKPGTVSAPARASGATG